MARCMQRWTLLLPVLALVIAVAACSRPGSEFVGNWVDTKNAKETIQIVRNGDQYLIVHGNEKIGAVYKDGGLEIGGSLGMARLTYIKDSDTILAPGFFGQSEYKRVK